MALTAEQKTAIIQQRLQQFEAELFQHELNRDVAVAINNTEAAAQSNAAIAQLTTAIDIHQQQLDALEPVVVESGA